MMCGRMNHAETESALRLLDSGGCLSIDWKQQHKLVPLPSFDGQDEWGNSHYFSMETNKYVVVDQYARIHDGKTPEDALRKMIAAFQEDNEGDAPAASRGKGEAV
jgi:hypothetical protein